MGSEHDISLVKRTHYKIKKLKMHSEFTMHLDTYLFTTIVKLSYCPFKKKNQ
jgi:hypothetical protein